ncbi:MAG: hypothetical protein Q4C46_02990 [Bacillota bacterium]|nr:hypothetical protein [Bacillota bacterium]
MTILKIFACVMILLTSIYLLATNLKLTRRSPNESSGILSTFTCDEDDEYDDYISFRLLSGNQPKVWEFKMSDKLLIIGRNSEKFKGEKSIQDDRTFSREHLGVYRDKRGRVHFNAIKGDINPVFVSTNGSSFKEETGSFILEPGTHRLRMGHSVFEIFFGNSYEMPPSERIKKERNTHSQFKNAGSGTIIINR